MDGHFERTAPPRTDTNARASLSSGWRDLRRGRRRIRRDGACYLDGLASDHFEPGAPDATTWPVFPQHWCKRQMNVADFSAVEQEQVEAGLRSSDAFTLRRSQILLASTRGQRPSAIARNLGCATQTVCNTIHAFEQEGPVCLTRESSRPKTVQAEFDQVKSEALRAILHQSPRIFGKPTSLWTLELAAAVCFERGLNEKQVSLETIRLALKRLGVDWQRAKHWITSPDPAYRRKKNGATH